MFAFLSVRGLFSQRHLEYDVFPQLRHHGQKVVLHANLHVCGHIQEPITADSSVGSLTGEHPSHQAVKWFSDEKQHALE